MADAGFDPERIFEALADSNVRFVLIGGMAAILHGDAGVTMDIDMIRSKSAADRDKDRRALPRLRELLDMTGQG